MSMLLCASPPPLIRRFSNKSRSSKKSLLSKRSISDFSFVKKATLSRGDSHQSDKTLVSLPERKELKCSTDIDIILIDAPTPPPKDRFTITLPPPRQLKPAPKRDEKPLPIPKPDRSLKETEPVYPWYRRKLHAADSASRYTSSQPSIFPRSDFALSASGSSKSGLNLFGGLSHDRAKNDVYSISLKEQSASRLYTIGDIPPPRFGHKSAYAGSVVVVWGGDITSATSNQLKVTAKYDNGLYFLNLASREWTRITVDGPSPAGRTGHSLVMIGPKIYIFGGEAYGHYFNDLWCFDLSSLVSKPRWEHIEPPSSRSSKTPQKPSRRTGHVCVAHKGQLIMFGGTDGQYHYNDTWSFDPSSKTWAELSCTGYIPSPRESHAAAVVDDIMYVFGGRGVDGANIGQLAAFKMSTQRWFMFQKMGPEPSPRSGHGMAAVGSKVYVIGGVCENSLDGPGQDANIMHILETNNIKYPTTKFSAPQSQTLVR